MPSAIDYPIPLNEQAGYQVFPTVSAGVPVARRLASDVFSLPMHPYLDAAVQDRIIEALAEAFIMKAEAIAV